MDNPRDLNSFLDFSPHSFGWTRMPAIPVLTSKTVLTPKQATTSQTKYADDVMWQPAWMKEMCVEKYPPNQIKSKAKKLDINFPFLNIFLV